MDRLETLNRALFLQINAPDGAGRWTIKLAIVLAEDAIYLVPLLLAGTVAVG